MSEKSDQNSNEDKNEFISTETINDSNDGEDYNQQMVENMSDLTFASLLKMNSSYPTQLFYTLSPISLDSTSMTRNRYQPIGGESLLQNLNPITTLTLKTDKKVGKDLPQSMSESKPVTDRPPLIGRTNSSSTSSHSTSKSIQRSDDSVVTQEISYSDINRNRDKERDSLAQRVSQLLNKIKRRSNEDEQSLGLINVMEDTFEDNSDNRVFNLERSEPEGKGKPFVLSQNSQKIVRYSSSDSSDIVETEESKDSITSSVSDPSLKSSRKSDDIIEKSFRNRSYSTGHKRTSIDISSIIMQRIQTKENLMTENSETQTSRSFLAEQSVRKENMTRVKRTIDVSKAIQTTDSFLNTEESNHKKKESKEVSSQTNESFGITSFLKELMKNELKRRKVSVGTQTIRSYLTEQSLKKKSKELKQQNKENINKISEMIVLNTKAIQTSYTSSANSESDSTLTNEKSSLKLRNKSLSLIKEKEPISWFIPIDKKSQNRNISRIGKIGRNSLKNKSNEQMSAISSPIPLQEAFNRHCIDMRINSQIRVNRINTIANLRKRTADKRLIEMAKQFIRSQESAKVIKPKVIQPVFKSTIKRFFTHEEMRAQTEKVYNNLPEVKALREKKKQKEREKNQRLLAQIYKYKLKDNALKGRLTWKITQSCLN